MTTPTDTDQTTETPVETPADHTPEQQEQPAPHRQGFFSAPRRYASILSDSRFFARIVPVEPDSSPASVAEQVELALELFSPFPISKLYHGHWWLPGSPRALVYAAYRKRFLPEETQYWHDDELVTPAFAAVLASPAAAGTVRVITGPDAITVLHWADDFGVPTQALIQPVAADTSPTDRVAIRDQMLRTLSLGTTFEEWESPALQSMSDNGDLTLVAAEREIQIPAAFTSILDVRDKEELAARARLHHRDILLWRVAVGAFVLLLLFGAGEAALSVGHKRLLASQQKIDDNKPIVQQVVDTRSVADQINQVVARRLLPLEILNLVRLAKPENTSLTSANFSISKDGTYSLVTGARSPSAAEVEEFVAKLRKVPEFVINDNPSPQQRNGNFDYNLTIAVKPGVVLPEAEDKDVVETPVRAVPSAASPNQ